MSALPVYTYEAQLPHYWPNEKRLSQLGISESRTKTVQTRLQVAQHYNAATIK